MLGFANHWCNSNPQTEEVEGEVPFNPFVNADGVWPVQGCLCLWTMGPVLCRVGIGERKRVLQGGSGRHCAQQWCGVLMCGARRGRLVMGRPQPHRSTKGTNIGHAKCHARAKTDIQKYIIFFECHASHSRETQHYAMR